MSVPARDRTQQIAAASAITREELLVEVNRRVREGLVVLPEDGPLRVKAVAQVILVIMGERFRAEEARRAALT